ncbi:Major facilitator superfamily domain, general substrate transporter [Ophiocordyceps camponoti-floridani]|uniref:Major facilitator superfamily domain, general substrate transporter n=1 Tax=Ophiocordyceps camponoti-floridani TaxID=2030778 RepID=A0A8H4QBF1_9HYPO|nr:Major facilitator superfamily domain, general substrate transporter [Ophiocordyceps camponoti-floridani]
MIGVRHQGRQNDSTSDRTAIVDATSSILYLYLTFDTPLPLPDLSDETLPPIPNLQRHRKPLSWSPERKYGVLAVACLAVFMTAYSAGAYSPAAALAAEKLATTDTVMRIGMVTFCLGLGLGPMFLAPVSEIWGRLPVFAAAAVVLLVSQIICSVADHSGVLLTMRFLVGVGASVFSIVASGVVVDLWDEQDRNTPLAMFSGFLIAGYAAGPLVATVLVGAIEDHWLLWRWTFWHQALADAAILTAFFVVIRESRESVVLAKRARLLNKWYEELETRGSYGLWMSDEMSYPSSDSTTRRTGKSSALAESTLGTYQRIRWLVRDDEERPSAGRIIATSILRPFYLLFTEPIVFFFSLWTAFAWGVLYLAFSILPLLHQAEPERSIRVYGAMVTASVAGAAASIVQQRLLRHPQWRDHDDDESFFYVDSRLWAFMRRHFPVEAPEARLYMTCLSTLLLPLGLAVALVLPRYTEKYGEALGMGIATWGIFSIYLASLNYLADAYGTYASSALASPNFCRNMTGGSFQLLTAAMLSNLGRLGVGAVLGSIAALLSVTPWVFVFFGERMRASSKFARSLHS